MFDMTREGSSERLFPLLLWNRPLRSGLLEIARGANPVSAFRNRETLLALGLVLSACVPECGQRERLARVDLAHLRDASQAFRGATGRWPSSLQEMVPPSCRGPGCTLRELHNDPWSHPYGLAITPERISVVSAGPSGLLGDGDDLDLVVWQR